MTLTVADGSANMDAIVQGVPHKLGLESETSHRELVNFIQMFILKSGGCSTLGHSVLRPQRELRASADPALDVHNGKPQIRYDGSLRG